MHPIFRGVINSTRKRLGSTRNANNRPSHADTRFPIRLRSRVGLEGFIDRFGPARIFGWARYTRPEMGPVALTFYSDGHFLCSALANERRPDVRHGSSTDDRIGFEFSVPEELRDSKLHLIDVRISGTSRSLLADPLRVRFGALSQLHAAQAKEPAKEDAFPTSHDESRNEQAPSESKVERASPAVAPSQSQPSAVPVAAVAEIPAASEVSSRPGDRQAPPGQMLPRPAANKQSQPKPAHGSVLKVSQTTVSGIALDPANSQTPVEVEFFANGRFLDRVAADLARSVIDGSPEPSRCGFRHTLTLDFSDAREFEISVRLRGGPELLNSPFRISGTLPEQPSEASPARSGHRISLLSTMLGYAPADAPTDEAPVERAVRAFMDLVRLDPSCFEIEGRSARSSSAASTAELVGSLDDRSCGVVVEDLWFADGSTLRFRIEPAPERVKPAARLQVYQADSSRSALKECGAVVLGSGPALLDAKLLNPLCPLLVVALAADSSIIGAMVLPFPSLCRGGAHHAELRVLGDGPTHMVSLRRVADALAAECLGHSVREIPFAIGSIKVDLRGATGAERIFSSPVRSWLRQFLDIDLLPSEIGDLSSAKVGQYLTSALVTSDGQTQEEKDRLSFRRDNGGFELTIPADAIPTINAVVARRIGVDEQSDSIVASFLVVDSDSGNPAYSVSMPPLDSFLLPLQPADAPLNAPLLSRLKPDRPHRRQGSPQLPLAIRFQVPATRNESQLVYPVAPREPVFAARLSPTERHELTVSALLAPKANTETALPLLRSLARQSIADRLEVIAVLSPEAEESAELRASLAELFPDRHLVILHAGPTTARLNLAAGRARGNLLLVTAETMVLHDTRTVESLYLLSREGKVASSSCMVLRETFSKKGSVIAFHSGGLFPTHVSFASSPSLIFKEIESSAALPLATYPVVGNSFRLALIRADIWKALGGLDEATFPSFQHDLDFSLRAAEKGFVHLCTSAISASDLATASPAEEIDILALGGLRPYRWQDILHSSTIVRDLR